MAGFIMFVAGAIVSLIVIFVTDDNKRKIAVLCLVIFSIAAILVICFDNPFEKEKPVSTDSSNGITTAPISSPSPPAETAAAVASGDVISSVLNIEFWNPLVINISEEYYDEFIYNPEYRVLTSTKLDFVSDAKLTIRNLETNVEREYKIYEIDEERTLGTFDSGLYVVRLFTYGQLRHEETITLGTVNLGPDGEWKYDMYVLDDFFENAIEKSVSIRGQTHLIEDKVFGICSEKTYMYAMFNSNFDSISGVLDGRFFFLPDKYTIYNTMSNAVMEPVEFDVP